MNLVKLNTKVLGLKKPITVPATVKNVRLASKMMITALEFEDQVNDEQEVVDTLKDEQSLLDQQINFLQKVLGLSDEQMDQVLDKIDFVEMAHYVSYVCNRLKGMSELDYQKLATELKKSPVEENKPHSDDKSTSLRKK